MITHPNGTIELEVGDTVKRAKDGLQGTIQSLGKDGKKAYVAFENGKKYSATLTSLVPQTPAQTSVIKLDNGTDTLEAAGVKPTGPTGADFIKAMDKVNADVSAIKAKLAENPNNPFLKAALAEHEKAAAGGAASLDAVGGAENMATLLDGVAKAANNPGAILGNVKTTPMDDATKLKAAEAVAPAIGLVPVSAVEKQAAALADAGLENVSAEAATPETDAQFGLTPPPEKPEIEPLDAKSPALFKNAVGCSIVMKKLGTRRRVKTEQISTDADNGMVHVAKDILECEEHQVIKAHDNRIRLWMKAHALPSGIRMGIFLVPLALVEKVDDYLKGMIAQRKVLIAKFLEVYETARNAAETRLGSLYNPADYPTPATVEASYDLTYRFVTFDVPTTLSGIKASIFAEEREKAKLEAEQALADIRVVLRAAMQELVDKVVDRLTPTDDGKTKIFHKSTLEKLNDFIEIFEARNIANDEELAQVVNAARDAMNGVDAKSLRKSPEMAATLKTKLEKIKGECDQLVMFAPDRMIALD